MPSMQILSGTRKGQVIELVGESFLLGRAAENDLSLGDDVRLSRHHARLVRQGTSWFIEDLGSANGTFVERGGRPARVQAPLPLSDGDIIVAGSLRAGFQLAPLGTEATVVQPASENAAAPPPAAVDFERTRSLNRAYANQPAAPGQELVPAVAPGLRPARARSARREGHRLLATLVVVLPALILAILALIISVR